MNHAEDHQHHQQHHSQAGQSSRHGAYIKLLLMALLSFIAMYLLMYAMVDRWSNVFNHYNQVYMALMMTAPMVVFELLLMRHMYKNTHWNIAIVLISVLVGVAAFICIRQQTSINDQQFLRSMIPHHAGAILMCKEAQLNDDRVKQLCQTIIKGQQQEINQMHDLLHQLSR